MHLFSSQKSKTLLQIYFTRLLDRSSDLVIVPNLEYKQWLEFEITQKWGTSFGIEILPINQCLSFFAQYAKLPKLISHEVRYLTHPNSFFLPLLLAWKQQASSCTELSNFLKTIDQEEIRVAELASISSMLFEISALGISDALFKSSEQKNATSIPSKIQLMQSLYKRFVLDFAPKESQNFDLETILEKKEGDPLYFLSHRAQWLSVYQSWDQQSFPYDRISFFAPIPLPLPLFEFLQKMHHEPSSKTLEVDIYQLSPSAYPWYDSNNIGVYAGSVLSNRLLDSLSNFGRMDAKRLHALCGRSEDFYPLRIDITALAQHAPHKAHHILPFCQNTLEHSDADFSLLRQVQADLLCAASSLPSRVNNEGDNGKSLSENFTKYGKAGDTSLAFHLVSTKGDEIEKAVALIKRLASEISQEDVFKNSIVYAPSIRVYREDIHYVCQRAGVPFVICEGNNFDLFYTLRSLLLWVRFAQNGGMLKDFVTAFQSPLGKECFGLEKDDFSIFEFLVDLGLHGGFHEENGSWVWAVSLLQEYAFGVHGRGLEAASYVGSFTHKQLLASSLRLLRLVQWCKKVGCQKNQSTLSDWMQWFESQFIHCELLQQLHGSVTIALAAGTAESEAERKTAFSFTEFWCMWLNFAKESSLTSSLFTEQSGHHLGLFEHFVGNALCFTSLSSFVSIGTDHTILIGMDESSLNRNSNDNDAFFHSLSVASPQTHQLPSQGSAHSYFFLLAIMATEKTLTIICSGDKAQGCVPARPVEDLYRYVMQNLVHDQTAACATPALQEKLNQSQVGCTQKPDVEDNCSACAAQTSLPDTFSLSFLEKITTSPVRVFLEEKTLAKAPSLFSRDFSRSQKQPFRSHRKEAQIERHLAFLPCQEDKSITISQQLYLGSEEKGVYGQLLKEALSLKCNWLHLPPSHVAFSKSRQILYKGNEDLSHHVYPALEVCRDDFISPFFDQLPDVLPKYFYIEGVLATRTFQKTGKLYVYRVSDFLRLWPKVLMYSCSKQFQSNPLLSVEFSSGFFKGQELVIDFTNIDRKKALIEFVEWVGVSLLTVSPLQPVWLEDYLIKGTGAVLPEIEKALRGEDSVITRDPCLMQWIWLNKNIDFEAWLNKPEIELAQFSKALGINSP